MAAARLQPTLESALAGVQKDTEEPQRKSRVRLLFQSLLASQPFRSRDTEESSFKSEVKQELVSDQCFSRYISIMSEQPDTLQFKLPSHANAVLSRINTLREGQHFCDITLLLRGPLGAVERPFCFHGHKVVLAAASDFLRDQFLLHEGQAELTVSVVTNVEVGKRLLLSCYTGLLEVIKKTLVDKIVRTPVTADNMVPQCELVTYLTVASALQMNTVVEKCAQVISAYFSPNSKEEEIEHASTQTETDTFDQQLEIYSQQQIVGRQDHAKPECSLTTVECEADKIQNVSGNNLSLNSDVQNFVLQCECHDVTNQSEDRKCPVDKGGLEEHSPQQHDGKVEPNDKIQDPVMEHEISISVDVPKKHVVKSGDTASSLVPKSYQCQDCDHVFENMDNYVKHVKDHQLFQCLVCEKSFSQWSALSHHLRVHSPVKPYRCPLCHSTFPNKASLQYHINLHIGFKPLKCNYCTAHSDYKQGLRRHLKDNQGKSTLENVLEEADC